jgi:nitrite reductase/ring-hydroxylating ferredoxin subunit
MFRALRSEELPAGEGVHTRIRRVPAGDGHVLLARLNDGQVVAFAPRCPHQVTALDDATISDGRMRCPRHGYIYDAQTGENVHPTRDNRPEDLWKLRPGYLPCFEVAERDGWIWVADEAKPPPESYDPDLEKPRERPQIAAEPMVTAPLAVATAAAPPIEQSLKFLEVTSGSTFDIRLPTTPREGFAWRLEMVGELLKVVEEQFEPGGGDLPCHRIRVAALGPGATTLRCTYAGSGDAEVAEIRIYVVRVG